MKASSQGILLWVKKQQCVVLKMWVVFFFLFSYEKSELPRAALSTWLQPRSLGVVGKGGQQHPQLSDGKLR